MEDANKDQYFYIADPDVKMVMWGKNITQEDIEEATPVAIFVQPVPDDIVKDFYTLISVKDPEGKIGQDVKAFIEAQMKTAESNPEMQGLAPGEQLPIGDILPEGENPVEGSLI